MACLKLTKKLAVQLLKENFPVPVKDLKLDETRGGYTGGYQRYTTCFGAVEVYVENDFYSHSGDFAIVICSGPIARNMTLLYDGDTLKHDYVGEDKFYEAQKRVELQEHIERENERKAEDKRRFQEAKREWERKQGFLKEAV